MTYPQNNFYSADRALLESLPAPVFDFNRLYLLTYANPAAIALLKTSSADLLSGTVLLADLLSAGDFKSVQACIEPMLVSRTPRNMEAELRFKGSAPVRALLSFTLFRSSGLQDGIRITLSPCLTFSRAPEADSARNRVIERITPHVIHDVNNQMSIILGHAQLLLNRLSIDPVESGKAAEQVKLILKSSMRGSSMLSEMLSYSRRKSGAREPVDMRAVIEAAAQLIGCSLGHEINLTLSLNAESHRVEGWYASLEDALINLIFNARDAMSGQGTLVISTSQRAIGEKACSSYGFEVRPGGYLMISISDTGIGMTPEIKARIFEPFFTTKDFGRGTGIGLANVYDTVKKHQGFIEVTSAPGQGTQFDVYLPLAEVPASSETPQMVM